MELFSSHMEMVSSKIKSSLEKCWMRLVHSGVSANDICWGFLIRLLCEHLNKCLSKPSS